MTNDAQKIEASAHDYSICETMPILRSMYPTRSRGQMTEEFKKAFKAGVSWRDQNPSPAVVGLVEALKDAAGAIYCADQLLKTEYGNDYLSHQGHNSPYQRACKALERYEKEVKV